MNYLTLSRNYHLWCVVYCVRTKEMCVDAPRGSQGSMDNYSFAERVIGIDTIVFAIIVYVVIQILFVIKVILCNKETKTKTHILFMFDDKMF